MINHSNLGNWLVLNSKFLEFSKLEIFETFQIGKITNFQNFITSKINKLSEFLQFAKLSKFQKLAKYVIFRPFDISHHSEFCRFSYLPFDINEF